MDDHKLDDDTLDDDAPLDPAESLRIIAAQRERVRSTGPDARVLYVLWGTSWLVGYLGLYLTASGALPGGKLTPSGTGVPAVWAFIAFSLCIVGAMATTIVYSIRSGSGVQGTSARTGAMYGWTWCIAFTAMGVVLGGLANAGASHEVLYLASNALACLIVGVLYMAGGTFWQDDHQYAIGIWIILVAALATYAGLPTTYLVMAALGGGGFYVGGLLEHVARSRRSRGRGVA